MNFSEWRESLFKRFWTHLHISCCRCSGPDSNQIPRTPHLIVHQFRVSCSNFYCRPKRILSKTLCQSLFDWQESCAIAKMTAQCAPYMGALKIAGTLWLCPRLVFTKFSICFCSDSPYECAYKFKVRSFTRSWDNRGYPKNLGSFWICPRSLLSKNFNGLRMHPMTVPAKLEVRSFTCSWVNRGYPKIGAVPGYAHTRGGRRGRGWHRSKER